MDADRLEELARNALQSGDEESALAELGPTTQQTASARLWQWRGLLERALDEHDLAIRSFSQAARLAPDDAGIAHGRARVSLEAGVDSIRLFEKARMLAPEDGAVVLGLAAARFAEGQGNRAVEELGRILDRAPLWSEGHMSFAQLQSMLGRPEQAGASLERALELHPKAPQVWRMLWDFNLRSMNFTALVENLDRANRAAADTGAEDYKAIAAAELGQVEIADRLFGSAPPASAEALRVWHIRHFIRTGRPERAMPLLSAGLAGSDARNLWPYASILWRLTGDPRAEWLHPSNLFVQVTDLSLGQPLQQLADHLRRLHVARGEYLDQSVRGGTQTDGPLFSRVAPVIRTLRMTVVEAVKRYIESLPDIDPSHPLLGPRRDRPIRFSGSWSVRLRGSGHHANHVHPQGWISSAFYVDLPERGPEEAPDSGWLTLGEPPEELGSGLPHLLKVEPKPGRLVLFPSWMWHGTVPFAAGERLTVAFDVRPPH